MKYGNFRPLLTSSQADITLFVSGRGPHENTPIFDTCKLKIKIIIQMAQMSVKHPNKNITNHNKYFSI